MSKPLILLVMVVYGYVAGEQYAKGNLAGALMWAAYSLANLGLYWQTR
jgi:hypothetical protein